MNIKEAYEEFRGLDALLSNPPPGQCFSVEVMSDMWRAIKAEAERPKLDWTQFDITPRPAVRQTRGQRSKSYEDYKIELGWEAKHQRFELGNVFEVILLIPVLRGWTPEEKAAAHLTPHQLEQGPDWDNIVKAIMDSLLPHLKHEEDTGDAKSWGGQARKLWVNALKGMIAIRNQDEAEELEKVRAELRGMGVDYE